MCYKIYLYALEKKIPAGSQFAKKKKKVSRKSFAQIKNFGPSQHESTNWKPVTSTLANLMVVTQT